jgi:hypothetical protein
MEPRFEARISIPLMPNPEGGPRLSDATAGIDFEDEGGATDEQDAAEAARSQADFNDDYDRVDPEDACPRCGEDDPDHLIWVDDRVVECVRCGTRYEPGKA